MALNRNLNNNLSPSANVTDDREAHPKFWIAAYTRPKSERKAAAELQYSGITTYVPTQTVVRQWSDRKKKVDLVIIPNIVFAYVEENEIPLVRQHHLINKLITFPGLKSPAHIPCSQIDILRFMLKASEQPIDFHPINYNIDDKVRVIRGNLKGLIGAVRRVSESKSLLIVSIDLLGGASVEISTSDLETYNN